MHSHEPPEAEPCGEREVELYSSYTTALAASSNLLDLSTDLDNPVPLPQSIEHSFHSLMIAQYVVLVNQKMHKFMVRTQINGKWKSQETMLRMV